MLENTTLNFTYRIECFDMTVTIILMNSWDSQLNN